MRADDLVHVWEQGQTLTPSGRGQALLEVLGIEAGRRKDLSVGQRDALLLELRAGLFGPDVTAVAPCPACGDRMEVSFRLDDVRTSSPEDPAAPFELTHGDFVLRVRPPTTGDLLALDGAPPGSRGREFLLGRCVLEARR